MDSLGRAHLEKVMPETAKQKIRNEPNVRPFFARRGLCFSLIPRDL